MVPRFDVQRRLSHAARLVNRDCSPPVSMGRCSLYCFFSVPGFSGSTAHNRGGGVKARKARFWNRNWISPISRITQIGDQEATSKPVQTPSASSTVGCSATPRRVAELLRTGLDLRDRHAAGAISRHGLALACGRLENQLSDLASRPRRTLLTSGWLNTSGSIGTSYSRSCVRRAWMRPTGVPSWRSASASSCTRSGEAVGPGWEQGRKRR